MVVVRRVVLVHGAWHGSWIWDPVLPLLQDKGIDPVALDLPSSHTGGDLSADADAVRESVLMTDEETVLVGHSYGGHVITEAALALPSVRHLVYICGALLDEGESITGASGGTPDAQVEGAGPRLIQAPDPARTLYADLPPELAAEYSASLTGQTTSSFDQPLSGASWKSIPSTYLVCRQDNILPLAVQREMAAQATYSLEIDSGHTPMAVAPHAVADLIEQACLRSGPRSSAPQSSSPR